MMSLIFIYIIDKRIINYMNIQIRYLVPYIIIVMRVCKLTIVIAIKINKNVFYFT